MKHSDSNGPGRGRIIIIYGAVLWPKANVFFFLNRRDVLSAHPYNCQFKKQINYLNGFTSKTLLSQTIFLCLNQAGAHQNESNALLEDFICLFIMWHIIVLLIETRKKTHTQANEINWNWRKWTKRKYKNRKMEIKFSEITR